MKTKNNSIKGPPYLDDYSTEFKFMAVAVAFQRNMQLKLKAIHLSMSECECALHPSI
jgi:hypothetical protein